MMIEVGIEAGFEASHALRGDFGPASEPHSHRYRVCAVFSGQALGPEGFLVDIALVEGALRSVSSRLEGRCLNDLEPFTVLNPTAEGLGLYVWEELERGLKGLLPRGVSLGEVTVWESPQAFARIKLA
jgi:6-pyruvoyltetrahydropterin/6-carboxytetrahydropterin synthase